MLQIRKAVPEDFDAIMWIYRKAQDFMIESGNPDQWRHLYPAKELVQKDIDTGICHAEADRKERFCKVRNYICGRRFPADRLSLGKGQDTSMIYIGCHLSITDG